MIIVNDIVKNYGKKNVLSHISLEIAEGKTILLKGENGCGKTTLFKILLGLAKSNQGSINYNNHSYAGLIEEPAFDLSLTGKQNIDLLINKYDNNFLFDLLKEFSILEERFKKVSKYSLGMKQKLALSYLLVKKPDYLFLDEPANSLDTKSVLFLRKQIENRKRQGLTTVIVSHQVKWIIDICDEIYCIKDNEIKLIDEKLDNDMYVFTFANEVEAKKAKELLESGRIEQTKLFIETEKGSISQIIRLLANLEITQVVKSEEEII